MLGEILNTSKKEQKLENSKNGDKKIYRPLRKDVNKAVEIFKIKDIKLKA